MLPFSNGISPWRTPQPCGGGYTNSPRLPHPQLFQLHGMQEPLGAARPRARHLSQAQLPAVSRGAGLGTPTSPPDPMSSALQSMAMHSDSGSHGGSSGSHSGHSIPGHEEGAETEMNPNALHVHPKCQQCVPYVPCIPFHSLKRSIAQTLMGAELPAGLRDMGTRVRGVSCS